MRSTYTVKVGEIERKWYVVDATGHTLGRLSSEIAKILRGKHKAIFTPHLDTGDYVVVLNADKITFTGNKLNQKKYYRHSGYMGGLKEISLKRMMETKSDEVIMKAVRGMLPKNALGRHMLLKLHVYSGATHKHEAQKPETLTITY